MKTKTVTTFMFSLLAMLLLVSCQSKEIPKAENFSFVFEEYSCGHLPLLNVLDTSKGTLVNTPLGETKSVEIPFVLTEGEIEIIYQEIISTNYFDYPSKVRVRGPVPSSTFRLKVVNGNFSNDVKWTDDFDFLPNYPEDDGLVKLFYLIQKIIRSHPEYPKPNALCL